MDELDWHADALGAALLVHQAGAVGGYDILGAGVGVIAHLVVTHLGDDFLEHRESAARERTSLTSGVCSIASKLART
jgi:hypothetical protein